MYTLSGAVNLARTKGGSFEKAAKEVFGEWGLEKPEEILVGERRIVNDIEARSEISILKAVVERCIEIAQQKRYHRGIHARKRPAGVRPKPAVPSDAPKPREEQLSLI